MNKVFSSYTNTVRRMIKDYNAELYKFFCEQNIEETWRDYDSLDGGINFYDIVIRIPVEFFSQLRKNGAVKEIEETINGFYDDAMRGGDESIQIRQIVLKPQAENVSVFGNDLDASMWKPDNFRLFISHLTTNKDYASKLKQCLQDYGIDCFVAHKDIKPSKEWELEIERALFTMDALCAIVVPDFIKSQWCDQEVGIALGQKKQVFAINRGSMPYGFFGKYQALKGLKRTVKQTATDVWKAISTNDNTTRRYLDNLVELILKVTTSDDAVRLINVLKQCKNVDKSCIVRLHDNYSSNSILNTSEIIVSLNSIFEKYGLKAVTMGWPKTMRSNDEDLPF